MKSSLVFALLCTCSPSLWLAGLAQGTEASVRIAPEWNTVVGVSKANVSISVCPEPPMRRGYPIHDQLFNALRDLKADYARLQPWSPYPKMAVAELRAPTDEKTYWDFSQMDPITEDFMQATAGHSVVFTFGTVPRWMWDTGTPTRYPSNPDEIDWTYNSDTTLSATTVEQFAAYQARLAGWYMNGGFTDELGRWHPSGHHYKIDYWEVLNEPDLEHGLTPAQYTQFYDAVVSAVRQVAPTLKFVGPSLAQTVDPGDYFVYFLDPKNHRDGIPIDMLSYHFYSLPDVDESPATMDYTSFQQADKLLTAARHIEAVRKRFSPTTLTAVNELGADLPAFLAPTLAAPIPKSHWIRAGAMWAYVYAHLALLGVDVVGASELIDYPGQVASSTLVDWETGRPNARYWVAKLLRDNFGPADQLIQPLPFPDTNPFKLNLDAQIYAQAFITASGDKKVLVINKRNRPIRVSISGAAGGFRQGVDEGTDSQPKRVAMASDSMRMRGLAVTVVTLPRG